MLTTLWCVQYACVTLACMRVVGDEVVWGCPRWRSASVLSSQFVLFPYMAWTDDTNAFLYTFALLLLLDMVLFTPSRLMVAHHAVCLAGHVIALQFPDHVHLYLQLAVVLEVGSGACNLWCLHPRAFRRTYVWGMTVSNAAACRPFVRWMLVEPAPPRIASAVSIVLFGGLLLARQAAVMRRV